MYCSSHDAAQISGTGTLYRGAYVSPGDDMKHNQVRCRAELGSFLDYQMNACMVKTVNVKAADACHPL